MKMLLFDYRDSEAEFFEKRLFNDIDITFIKEPLNSAYNLTEKQIEETDIVSVFISSTLTDDVLKKFKNLRVVATRSTGYNHIDINYCIENNITVFNVAKYGETSVAQFSIGLMLMLVRNLLPAYLDMQRNMVVHSKYEGKDLGSMTIGVIGGGSIGGAIAKIAKFLGMRVLICSYAKDEELELFAEYVSLDKLLAESDVITLHVPATPESYHLLGEKEFEKMKDGVFIVNTARGELIDIVALYDNVISGKVKAAALDVLECEYLAGSHGNLIKDIKNANTNCVANALITQKLLAMENVIITPHIAYNTVDSVNILLEKTFNNILDYYKSVYNNNKIC